MTCAVLMKAFSRDSRSYAQLTLLRRTKSFLGAKGTKLFVGIGRVSLGASSQLPCYPASVASLIARVGPEVNDCFSILLRYVCTLSARVIHRCCVPYLFAFAQLASSRKLCIESRKNLYALRGDDYSSGLVRNGPALQIER